MPKRQHIVRLTLIAAAALLAACGGEQALLVSPRIDGAPPLGTVANPDGAAVHPVRRQIPLLAEASWSFDVGPEGASVRDAATGLSITVPAGAVATQTRITVIALRGAALAYRFEPHGLQFAKPVLLTQSLRGLQFGRPALGVPSLFGGYFAADALAVDDATGDARVIEILPVQIDVRGRNAVLAIRHFSGYTVASAVADSSAGHSR